MARRPAAVLRGRPSRRQPCWRCASPRPGSCVRQRHTDGRRRRQSRPSTYTERPTGCTAILVDGDASAACRSTAARPRRAKRISRSAEHGGQGERRLAIRWQRLRTRFRDWCVTSAGGARHRLGHTRREGADCPRGEHLRPVRRRQTGERADATCGYKAAQAATTSPVTEGNVGAGAGAAVGQMGGAGRAMKSGLGSAASRCQTDSSSPRSSWWTRQATSSIRPRAASLPARATPTGTLLDLRRTAAGRRHAGRSTHEQSRRAHHHRRRRDQREADEGRSRARRPDEPTTATREQSIRSTHGRWRHRLRARDRTLDRHRRPLAPRRARCRSRVGRDRSRGDAGHRYSGPPGRADLK